MHFLFLVSHSTSQCLYSFIEFHFIHIAHIGPTPLDIHLKEYKVTFTETLVCQCYCSTIHRGQVQESAYVCQQMIGQRKCGIYTQRSFIQSKGRIMLFTENKICHLQKRELHVNQIKLDSKGKICFSHYGSQILHKLIFTCIVQS